MSSHSSISNKAPIAVVAINARFSHCSLAARSLVANMSLPAALREYEIKQSPATIAIDIIRLHPAILAFGVYIWNRSLLEELIPMLRTALPDTTFILGGPEISYDTDSNLASLVDAIICGEAEEALPQLCKDILDGKAFCRITHPPPPDLNQLIIPAQLYSDSDIAHRNIYIETSRGCPCACRFCLSSCTRGVRYYPLKSVFEALEHLIARGAHHFRFIDRSFNLAGERPIQILQFFLARKIDNLFLHLEVVPECISPALRKTMLGFPPGALHVETGIQSLNPDVLKRVHRIADPDAACEGIQWLTHTAKATVHADLIAGLPGENMESFADGFRKLIALRPSEIQLGILKHLPGTDLNTEPGMVFHPKPPYCVIQSDAMSPRDLDQIQRFAAHWERVVNRNHFPRTIRILLQTDDAWLTFDAFSRQLEVKHGRHGVGLVEMARTLFEFICKRKPDDADAIRKALAEDYLDNGRRQHLPAFLRD